MHRSLSRYEDCPARPVVSATARSRAPRARLALRCSCAASPTTGGTSGGLARVTTSPSARPNTRSRYLGPGYPSGDQAVVRATSRDVAALQFNAVRPATGGRDPSRPGPPARSCRRPTNRGLAHRWGPIPMRCLPAAHCGSVAMRPEILGAESEQGSRPIRSRFRQPPRLCRIRPEASRSGLTSVRSIWGIDARVRRWS